MSLLGRIANVFRPRHVDSDIAEELRSHWEEAREAGRDADEIRRAFGSTLHAHEAAREAMIVRWLDGLLADVRFGWRQLAKHKVASVAAVVSLGLGIGSCVAAFRLIDALLLRPMPVSDPAHLFVVVYQEIPETMDAPAVTADTFDYPAFRQLRAAVQGKGELMAISHVSPIGITFGSYEETERVTRQFVSGWTFAEFGMRPSLGRLFNAADDVSPGAHPVAVLSYEYWTRRFGRDPRVIGRTFRSGDAYTIVGVAPEGFLGTETGRLTDVFLPTMMNKTAIDASNWNWFRIWARPASGVSPAAFTDVLQARALAIRRQRAKDAPASVTEPERRAYLAQKISLENAAAGVSTMQRYYRRPVWALGGLVVVLLLIACANVANLRIAQAASRAREMALRVSIGAGRKRLTQLLLVEGALIGAAAAAVGLAFAWWAAPYVAGRIDPQGEPLRLSFSANWRVSAFAAVATIAAVALFALLPSLRASLIRPVAALKEDHTGRGGRRLMGAVTGLQAGFCCFVLFAGTLFLASFDRITRQPTGFVAEGLLAVELGSRENLTSQQWNLIEAHIAKQPGVESAALCSFPLLSGSTWSDNVWVSGIERTNTWFLDIAPGWIHTMRIPLLGGREFTPTDRFERDAIVNRAFARHYFPGQNVVGQTFEAGEERRRYRIAGLVEDARYQDVRGPISPTVYIPLEQAATSPNGNWRTLMVRAGTPDILGLDRLIRREVAATQPGVRVVTITSQSELVRWHTVRDRLLATLSAFFCAVAVVLAAVGLYGVLNYAVLQRRRELGIRIALGGRSAHIARIVLLGLLAMVLLGSAAGIAAGLAIEPYIRALLFEVEAADPRMVAAPVLVMLAAAALAALMPVWRAIQLDPARLLRSE